MKVPTLLYTFIVPVAEDILAKARRSDRAAVEAVLLESFPAVHRMAHALVGRPAPAQRVVRLVMGRGVRVMPRWRRGIAPENWFYHHTLLTARSLSPGAPSTDEDLLITAGPVANPEYSAFVRALRGLPRQQMEAFVLHHGEQLNVRLLGVAMDCSMSAAGTHLQAAEDALRTMTTARFAPLTAALERAYRTLTPAETIVHTSVRQQAGAVLWKTRLRKLARRLFITVLVLAVTLAVWRWHALLLHWFDALRSRAQSQPA